MQLHSAIIRPTKKLTELSVRNLKQQLTMTTVSPAYYDHSLSVFRIQIGAPRGNDTELYGGVREPGVVFRCPIAEPCHAVKFDADGKLATELIILVAVFDYGVQCCREYINLCKRSFYLFMQSCS
jgi:hypothetical protein